MPWPEDSERTFWSSSQAATCPPVNHTRRRLHTVPLIAERQTGKLQIPIFIVFGLTRPGIEPKPTASVADALSTRPLIGCKSGRVLRSKSVLSARLLYAHFAVHRSEIEVRGSNCLTLIRLEKARIRVCLTPIFAKVSRCVGLFIYLFNHC